MLAAREPHSGPTYDWFMRQADFFEELGTIYRCRGIDLRVIHLLIGSIIIQQWEEVWDDLVMRLRGSEHPTYYENFEAV